jgi:hypothetical protein
VETASTKTVITFNEAPDPEGIKFFVTNLSRKHLGLDSNLNKDEIAQIVDQKLEKPNSKVARVD